MGRWLDTDGTTSPPNGPFPRLGLLVREITGGASIRQIAIDAPVSKSLAQKLVHGHWVEDDTLLIFAAAYNRAVNPLREACNRAPYMVDPVTKEAGLTIEHLRVLLPHKVSARFEAAAQAQGLVQPEQLVGLMAELMDEGLQSRAERLREAQERALEGARQVRDEHGAEALARRVLDVYSPDDSPEDSPAE